MPELRKDPVIGRWVIISTDRGNRPSDWKVEPAATGVGFCPFCPGNEDKTPPEILADRPGQQERDAPGWNVRVVPNKFPALQVEGDLNRRGEGIYDMMNGVGAHEVVIETPDHSKGLVDLEVEHIRTVLVFFRERMLDLKRDIRFKYILVFKNHGRSAGASLEHTHSQLIATPIVPKRVTEEIEGSTRYYNYKERCIFCDIVRQEIQAEKRIVVQSDSFIAHTPYASRFPFECWILPVQHYSHYESMPEDEYDQLARVLKETLQRIDRLLGNPPYNFIIHTSPIQEQSFFEYHWHMEIMPKLTHVAGFEWGSGFYINPTPPEEAAEQLRALDL